MQTLPNENIEKQGSYAGFLPRLIAFFIDWVVVSLGVALVKGIFLSGLESWPVMTMDILFSYSIMEILTWLLKVSYFVISMYCTQTTLGKYLMKLKVVGVEQEEVPLLNLIYRETVGRFLSSFIFIGYLIIIGDKEKAALHDKLADTRVIYSCNVKVTKKVVVTKVWNNQPAAQTDTQSVAEVKEESEQTQSVPDEKVQSVEINVQPEVVAVVPGEAIEEEMQEALQKTVDVSEIISETEVEQSTVEEIEEEEEKKENEVI